MSLISLVNRSSISTLLIRYLIADSISLYLNYYTMVQGADRVYSNECKMISYQGNQIHQQKSRIYIKRFNFWNKYLSYATI